MDKFDMNTGVKLIMFEELVELLYVQMFQQYPDPIAVAITWPISFERLMRSCTADTPTTSSCNSTKITACSSTG